MNKNLIIILLAIISVGSIGYIVYDKVSEKDVNESNENVEKDNKNIISGYFEDFLNNDIKEEIEDDIPYQNLKMNIGDLEFVLNCKSAGDIHGDYCHNRDILLNGNIVSSASMLLGDINTNPYLIITDKFLIIQEIDYYNIYFYDKNGNKLNIIDNVVYSYLDEDSNSYDRKPMYINDNKLYFLTYEIEDKNNFSYNNYNKICSKYIDLSSDDFETVDNGNCFNAKISCKEC